MPPLLAMPSSASSRFRYRGIRVRFAGRFSTARAGRRRQAAAGDDIDITELSACRDYEILPCAAYELPIRFDIFTSMLRAMLRRRGKREAIFGCTLGQRTVRRVLPRLLMESMPLHALAGDAIRGRDGLHFGSRSRARPHDIEVRCGC